ncbi:MAG: twin-arginine translocation signal domain-containing protein, partial [Chloroflexi bacterium]
MTQDKYPDRKRLDLEEMRQELVGKTGKSYWRSLDELAKSDDFEELVRQEFPRQASLLGSLNRRDFLKVLGASLAMAGLTACAPQANEKILPYTKPPEELVPGRSLYYASAQVHNGYARGVLIETTTGRPIKIEGNPQHPDSQGATDVFMQASILDLYDPERAQAVSNAGAAATWDDFAAAAPAMAQDGLRILSGPVTSPSLTAQIQALLDTSPGSVWYQYSPVGRGNTYAGAAMAFGEPFEPLYNFANAEVILSLDCDFLFMEPGHLRYSRDFSARHRPISADGIMSRLYMLEGSSTLTGSNADHRLAVNPAQVEAFARAIAARLGVGVEAPTGEVPGQDWLEPLAADLQRAGAAALVLAGERQPPAVHALAHAMNQALGSIGSTVTLLPPATLNPGDP